ncbi:ribbon-helix-helix domain-containing protein [Desulfurobacterium atlanticum]|uniref:Ribbon-helix-helix domain-containing protein n=1 Tax=Desulfurobacterium atlanticum TaxID=240169 RepID=A0A238YCT8_9BACT|nr:ribbon-helix-helix domain-containing protein [Desulfurobacterium atlanticum]SNR68880.1 Ribbon-helix-helix domain-containing protein [Desulfurobacterium atlanticum]
MAITKKLISMDKMLAEELSTVSKILGISQKEIVEKALDFYFDYLDVAVAEKISKEIKEGRMKVYEAKEVFRGLGIDV